MKKIFYFLLLFQLFSCQGQKKANNENYFVLPCQIGNKWGLVDTLGVVQVKPQYDKLLEFKYNIDHKWSYFIVEKDKKIKMIDWENNELFPDYDLVLQKDGKVRFSKNGKLGFRGIWDEEGAFIMTGNEAFLYDKIYSLDIKELGDKATVIEIINKKGLNGEMLETIFPVKYDSISYKKREKGIVYYGYNLGDDKKVISVDSVSVSDNSFISNSPAPAVFIEKDDLVLPLPRRYFTESEKADNNIKEYKEAFDYKYTYQDVIKSNTNNKYAIVKGIVTNENKLNFEYDSTFVGGSGVRISYFVLIAKKANKYYMYNHWESKPSGGPYDDVEQRSFINTNGRKEYYLVFRKGNKYGSDVYTFNKDSNLVVYNRIPFEFDEIRDGSVVVKNGLYGIYDNMPTYGKSIYNKIHIKPKYKEVPELYMDFNDRHVGNIYQCITTEGRKIFVYANGLELYRKK